jgi:exonuclease III
MAHINIRNSLANMHELVNLLNNEEYINQVGQIDVLALTETKEFHGRLDTAIEGFLSFGALDSGSKGGNHAKGGVAIYVRKSMKCHAKEIALPSHLGKLDNVVWVELATPDGIMAAGCTYNRPQSPVIEDPGAVATTVTSNRKRMETLAEQVAWIRNNLSPVALSLMGDFNARLGQTVGDHSCNAYAPARSGSYSPPT